MTEMLNTRFAVLLGSLGEHRAKFRQRISRGQAELVALRNRNQEENIQGSVAQVEEEIEAAYAACLSAVFGRMAVDNALTLLCGLMPVRMNCVYNAEDDLRSLERRIEVVARTYGIASDVVALLWLKFAENELHRAVQYLEQSSGVVR